jgi:hypothetical protein
MHNDFDRNFPIVYARLKTMLVKFAHDSLEGFEKSADYELIGPPTPVSRGKPVWFGAVRMGKRYVSYHLMPVYVFPDLLDGISPQLKKRMQGKSCFNFTHVDDVLFQELEVLTERSHARFKEVGFLE